MSGLVATLRHEIGDRVLAVTPGFGPTTVDVAAGCWRAALAALQRAGASYFDFLTAYDEGPEGFAVVAHVSTPDAAEHLLLRTGVPRQDPALPSVVEIFPGAAWHERETHEMFGIDFPGHPGLTPLLLPEGFTAHPLRKDFVLVPRVVKPWPGAAQVGSSGTGASSRRAVPPPGVSAGWPDQGPEQEASRERDS